MRVAKMQNKILLLAATAFLLAISIVYNCYALGPKDYFYEGGYEDCIDDSGGRGGISAVQFACDRASIKSQSGCALWLGAPGDTVSTTIRVSGTGNQPINFYGICTLRPDRAINITITGDNGSITNIGSMDRTNNWGGSPSSATSTINVDKFIQGLSGYAIGGGYCRYMRSIRVGRTHGSDPSSSHAMSQPITLDLPGQCPTPTPVPDPDLCMTWTPATYTNSLIAGATSFVTSVDTRVRNGRLSSEYNKTEVYAMPTDRIEWYTCYYPGVQPANDKKVSEIRPNPGWIGYGPLDHESCQPAAPVTKEYLYQHWPWQNQYTLTNTIGGSDIPHSDFTGAVLGVPRTFPRGDTKTDGAKNEVGTVFLDAGHMYTETSETGNARGPAELTVADGEFVPESSYEIKKYAGEGTCSKLDNNVEKIKVAGTLYPVCTATATFPDASAPLKGLEPTGAACWQKTDVCKKQCSDCGTDATCAASCCSTCDDVDDSYQCLTESCTNTYVDTNTIATITKESTKDDASVIIPYNFTNFAEASIVGSTIFSGETFKVRSAEVMVGVRSNGKTNATYATIVRGATTQLVGYVSTNPGGGEGVDVSYEGCSAAIDPKQCAVLYNSGSMTLNPTGDLGGGGPVGAFDGSNSRTFSAFDATAGDYICVRLGVYPYSSGYDGNWNDPAGSHTWYWSAPSCAQIHKRPNFQVWGGDMYAVGNVNSPLQSKRNIYVDYKNNISEEFNTDTGVINGYFGSWVEEGLVIKDGITKTVASGAGLGKSGSLSVGVGNKNTITSNNGWSPLSFANHGMTTSGTVGESRIGSGIGDRELLIDYWANGRLKESYDLAECKAKMSILKSDNITACKRIESGTGTDIIYAENGGGITLNGNVANNQTYLIKSNETVTINNDIKYTGAFTGLGSVPKVIIYAKNVNITCGVDEVDAIIITATGGKVNTCSNATERDNNDKKRLRQLIIRGVVIADSVKLERTYGGAAWKGSGANGQGEAAEIFDYDSTMLMWSEFMSGSAETDTLQTVYQHELAPRY